MCQNAALFGNGLRNDSVVNTLAISANPLQDLKILALSKLIFSVAQIVQYFFDRVENIVGNGENAG